MGLGPSPLDPGDVPLLLRDVDAALAARPGALDRPDPRAALVRLVRDELRRAIQGARPGVQVDADADVVRLREPVQADFSFVDLALGAGLWRDHFLLVDVVRAASPAEASEHVAALLRDAPPGALRWQVVLLARPAGGPPLQDEAPRRGPGAPAEKEAPAIPPLPSPGSFRPAYQGTDHRLRLAGEEAVARLMAWRVALEATVARKRSFLAAWVGQDVVDDPLGWRR